MQRRKNIYNQKQKKKKRKKLLILFIDFFIVALIILAAYIFLKPSYDHYKNDQRTEELQKKLDTIETDPKNSKVGIWVNPHENPVNGGGVDIPPGFDDQNLPTATDETNENGEVFIEPIARIIIKKIDVNMPIVQGAGEAQLSVAVGWYPESSELATGGNSVLLGHNMYTRGRHFNRLDELVKKDKVILQKDGKNLHYIVDKVLIVEPDKMFDYFSSKNKDELTLVTCTPRYVASHRRLVICKRDKLRDKIQTKPLKQPIKIKPKTMP